MLCSNCSKLVFLVTTRICNRCGLEILNNLSVVCDKCSALNKICSVCLKKIQNQVKRYRGCSGCKK